MARKKILMVGGDLSSNGGIASVIKSYHYEWKNKQNNFDIILLKTSYYKDKETAYEFIIFLKSFIKAFVVLATENIRIVHIHSSSGVSFVRKSIFVILSKAFLKKVVFHIHASTFYNFYLSKNIFLRFYINHILKITNLTITLCRDWEYKLKCHYPKIDVRTLHNPINIKTKGYTKRKKSNDELRVLFLGFLIPSKGILDILRIAKKCYDNDIKNIKFVIAGKGELEEKIKTFIENNSLIDIVRFVGWVSGNQKCELLKTSDIFFLPSYNEGMPISILEAMSYSLPIVSTRISGIPDLVIDEFNGYLFEPGQIDQFYEVIMKMKNNKKLIEKLGHNSFKHVHYFSSDSVFVDLKKIYSEITSNTYR